MIVKFDEQTRKRPEVSNVVIVSDWDKATEEARIEQLPQENNLVNYPYREISVRCGTNELPIDEFPMCYFIQTRDEFNNLCRVRKFATKIFKRDSEINFFKEIVLGILFQMDAPDYHFQSMYDETSNNIHIYVHYMLISGEKQNKIDVLKWIAVPKPLGNYQVHFHFMSSDLPEPEPKASPYQPNQRPPIPIPEPWYKPVPVPETPPGPVPRPSPIPKSPGPIPGQIKTIIYDSN